LKVTVVGLNPYDHRVRDWGLYVDGMLPVVLGNDIAGIIEKCGPGVTDLKRGDKIFGQTNYLKRTSDQAGLQEYAILDAYTTAKIPPGLTHDDGASLVCNIVAPFWALFGRDGLALPFPFADSPKKFDYASQKIVIIGAGSNCGKYAVQSAALAGFGTIVAIAGKTNETELRLYGATHVVNRHASDVEKEVREIVGDDLIYAFDAWNVDHTLGVSLLSNSKKGTLACIVPGQVPVDKSKIGAKSAGYEDKFAQGQSHNQPELGVAFWKSLPGWMAEGKVKPTAYDTLQGLDVGKINDVLDAYRDGRHPARQIHVHL